MLAAKHDGAAAYLRLMGPLRLTSGGAAVDISSRRARAVLSYLAMAPDRSATRERLCGLLWSDRGEAQARASLRQCLLELRAALSKADLDLLGADRETVRLNEGVDTDVEDVEAALKAQASDLSSLVAELGDARLLEDLEIGGLFEDWRRAAGERVDRAIAGAVAARLRTLEQESDWPGTLHLAESYLRRDPLDEMVTASAIRANIALGAAGAAKRQYQTLDAALARDLGVRPGSAARDALAFAPRGDPAAEAAAAVAPPVSPPLEAPRQPLPLPDRPSIAVLPFKNLSGDPEQEYFADAITDDIVNALARWRWFFVIDRVSSFAYKDRDVDTGRVGAELGIRYVLRGSVRKSGSRIRITAQLIDALDGPYLWTDKFDRTIEDLLAVQDEITEHVVTAIEPAILRGEGARASRKKPADFSSLDFFYRAMWHFNKMSDEDDLEALKLFDTVIARNPELPLGYVGRARVLYSRSVLGWSSEPMLDLERSREAARIAIRLDALDALGYFASSGASLYLGDHSAALEDARRANLLNPNFAYGNYRLGQVLIFSGSPHDAISPIERSIRLSPYDPQITLMIDTLALAYYQDHDYARAAELAQSAVNMGHVRANYILAAAHAMNGSGAAAAEAADRLRGAPGRNTSAPSAPYADLAMKDHLTNGFRIAGAET